MTRVPRAMLATCLVLTVAACQAATTSPPRPLESSRPTTAQPCVDAIPEDVTRPTDPSAAAFLSAIQDANGNLRQLHAQGASAQTVHEKKDLALSHVRALHQLQLRLHAIHFPSQTSGDVGQLLRSIGDEQSAYIHAAGSPTPDAPPYLAEIDRTVQSTHDASNQLRHDLGLPPTSQCL